MDYKNSQKSSAEWQDVAEEALPPLTAEEKETLIKKTDEQLLPKGWVKHVFFDSVFYTKPISEETRARIAQIAEESKRKNRKWLWWRRYNK